jgi:hypothetical protein
MLKTIIVVIGMLLFANCTNEDSARRILEANGYKDIQFTGYDFLAGGKDDVYKTGFIATSPNGTRIEGTVTEGLVFKDATIRFK